MNVWRVGCSPNLLPESLPEQQGLKHHVEQQADNNRRLPESLPEQQGLKLDLCIFSMACDFKLGSMSGVISTRLNISSDNDLLPSIRYADALNSV